MDYVCSSHIVNNSSTDIKVDILFDRESLEKIVKNRNYIKAIEYYNEQIGQPVIFDSLTLKTTFTIPKNNKSEISHTPGGRGITPDYSIIKEIVIFSNNQTKIYPKESFDTLFKEVQNGEWQLIIK